MKIADIELGEKPLFLAPMEDVTDPSFRYMCKKFGADVVYTEFISSDGLIRDAWKSRAKLNIAEFERPVGIQIYGHLIMALPLFMFCFVLFLTQRAAFEVEPIP